jgi:S-adenosyl-L-methionine hydrolase (adenosine-forming)
MPIITLTTDFGARDGYVGAMKGVLATLAPQASVIDLAHDVPRHDIAHAAWVLRSATHEFPPGTIHVAVVDPGVGGGRAEVVVSARGQLFVGPDNGIFAHVARRADGCWAIASTGFRRPVASATFHGRDVFAPAAAALARGAQPHQAGPTTRLVGRLPWPEPAAGGGVVVHIDVYGNLITDLTPPEGKLSRVEVAGRTLPLARTYEDVAVGALCAYVGSMGTIEIAAREGSAAAALACGRGEAVRAS